MPLPAVLADAGPTALLSHMLLPVTLADGCPAALFVLVSHSTVLADAGSAALLAHRPLSAVPARQYGPMVDTQAPLRI